MLSVGKYIARFNHRGLASLPIMFACERYKRIRISLRADWPGKEAVRMSPAVLSMWVALTTVKERSLIFHVEPSNRAPAWESVQHVFTYCRCRWFSAWI